METWGGTQAWIRSVHVLTELYVSILLIIDHGGGQGGSAAHLGGLSASGLRHDGGCGRQTALSGSEAEGRHRPGPGQVGQVMS